MSDDSRAVVPAAYHDLLAAPALAHVATIGPDGAPQSTPVWFDWDGVRVLLVLAPDRQKVRNLRRDPRLAVSMVDPADPTRFLEVRGRVTFESDPERAVLKRIVLKYTGSDDLSWVDGERIVVAIEPNRVTYRRYGGGKPATPANAGSNGTVVRLPGRRPRPTRWREQRAQA